MNLGKFALVVMVLTTVLLTGCGKGGGGNNGGGAGPGNNPGQSQPPRNGSVTSCLKEATQLEDKRAIEAAEVVELFALGTKKCGASLEQAKTYAKEKLGGLQVMGWR